MKEEQAMDEQLLKLKREIREMIRLDYIVPEDIPAIELYMDQVTSFMDKQLSGNKRDEKDKVLTKTMINNYTKNRLLPPPEKKRYSKEHIILLIYIYYLKNVISVNDVQKLIEPMNTRFFEKKSAKKEKLSMDDIYGNIYELEKKQYFITEKSTAEAMALTEELFPKAEDEYLNKMAFIFLLSYDIYTKKRLIEKLIDEMELPEEENKTVKKTAKQSVNKAVKKPAVRSKKKAKRLSDPEGRLTRTLKGPIDNNK